MRRKMICSLWFRYFGYAFFFTSFLFLLGLCHEENYFKYEACYGNTADSFVQPSCSAGQVIFIRDIRAYSKRTDTGCPQIRTSLLTTNSCCEYHPDDCGARYEGYSLSVYRACSGKQSCNVKVSWMETPVIEAGCIEEPATYHARTSYMVLYYNCIPGSATNYLDANFTLKGTDLYLTNRDYPEPIPDQNVVSSICSIEASCTTSIIISAIDVNFTTINGHCNGGILVHDGSDTTTITCNTTNDLRTKQLYASITHFLTINVVGNSSEIDFLFWVRFSAADPSAEVTLSCGSEALSSPNRPIPVRCPILETDCDGVFCDFPADSSACTGANAENKLTTSCGADHVISVKDVSSAAKPAEVGCASTVTGLLREFCCSYNAADCRYRYTNSTSYSDECSGQSECSPFSASVVQTSCDPSVFPSETNYMTMEYYCVNRSLIVPACSGHSTTGSSVYVWNKHYPEVIRPWAEKNCSLFMSTDKDTPVRVTILDLQLAESGTADTECKQEVVMTESDTIEHNIGCEYNALYTVQEVLLTNTGNLDIEFLNKLDTAGGRYWIEISAVDPTAILSLSSIAGPESTTTLTPPETTTSVTTTVCPYSVGCEPRYLNAQACYGTTEDSFLTPSCPAGQVIVVLDIRAYSRRVDSGCPPIRTSIAVSDSCCEYRQGDCGARYEGNSLLQYRACSRKSNCTANVAWMETPVATAGCSLEPFTFHARTSYMVMSYSCISENDTRYADEDFTVTGSVLYLSNRDYPDPSTSQGSTSSTCSLEVSCSTSIIISAIDLGFLTTNEQCNGEILIEDGDTSTILSCNTVNSFRSKQLFVSSTHFIRINIDENNFGTGFLYWIKFSAADPSAELTLACGTNAMATPGVAITARCSILPQNCNGVFCKVPEDSSTCYGTDSTEEGTDILSASCGTDHVISVKEISGAYKPHLEICTSGQGRQSCCSYNASDCRVRYQETSKFFNLCTGKSTCSSSADNPVQVSCTPAVAATTSNYMTLEYYCIDKNLITPACSNMSSAGTTVYMTNKEYPADIGQWTEKNCSLSIETDKDTPIRITILDLNLAEEDGAGVPECKQELVITESDTLEHNIDCEYNKARAIQEILLTNAGDLTVEFINSLNTGGGRYWIEFSAVDTTATLALASVQGPSTTTTTTPTTTPTTTTTPGGPDILPLLLAILVPIAVLIVLAIIIICAYVHRGKLCKGKEKKPEKVIPEISTPVDVFTTAALPSTAAVSTSYPKTYAGLRDENFNKHFHRETKDIKPLRKRMTSSLLHQLENDEKEKMTADEKKTLSRRKTFHAGSAGGLMSSVISRKGSKDALLRQQQYVDSETEQKKPKRKKKKKRKWKRTVEAVSAFGYPPNVEGMGYTQGYYPPLSHSVHGQLYPTVHPPPYRQDSFPVPVVMYNPAMGQPIQENGTVPSFSASYHIPPAPPAFPTRLPTLAPHTVLQPQTVSHSKRAWKKAMTAAMFAQSRKIHPSSLDITDADQPELRETMYLDEESTDQSYA